MIQAGQGLVSSTGDDPILDDLIEGFAKQLQNGDRVDLTRQAKLEAPAGLVKVSDAGQVRPAGDGTGAIKFSAAGQGGTIPLVVSGQKAKYEVSLLIFPSRTSIKEMACHVSPFGYLICPVAVNRSPAPVITGGFGLGPLSLASCGVPPG